MTNAVCLNRGDKVQELENTASKLFQTNVVGNIHLFNLFLPFVLKGKVKKVIAISSGHADLEFINALEVENSALYAASKAALNVIVAKFNAQYKKDGVLFVSLSPGVVEVGHFANGQYCLPKEPNLNILLMRTTVTPEQIQGLMGFMGKLKIYAPDFNGATPVDEAIPVIRSTWEKISIDGGYGGAFISQHGNKKWL
jgi:NADP-dependent 3-hydroxy acid dehydrogenase YdfG